ncbi:MAG: PIN domain-containing protein [Candidatus Aenigmatarchaeota archaeon]
MIAILLDTSFILAYFAENDVHHTKAVAIMDDIISKKYGTPVISDYIFDEMITISLRKLDISRAKEIGESLLNSELIIMRIDNMMFKKAWSFFRDENVLSLSFTDCTNLSLMNIFNIHNIATFDKAFNKVKDIYVVS